MARIPDSKLPALVLALGGLLGGCQQATSGAVTDDGVSAIQFKDIPVPAGMRLLERYHTSDARQVGEYRYGNFVYAGSVPLAEVSDYMLERMPQHSWELVNHDRAENGGETLRFRRGKYLVECSLSKQPDASSRMQIDVRTILKEE